VAAKDIVVMKKKESGEGGEERKRKTTQIFLFCLTPQGQILKPRAELDNCPLK
jgi:hypothetical protein